MHLVASGTELPIPHIRFHDEYWGQTGPTADIAKMAQLTRSGRALAAVASFRDTP
jgi:hypothetical protein